MIMSVSRPAVRPVIAVPVGPTGGANDRPQVRMKYIQGMPGTTGGLILRLSQFVSALISLYVMLTTFDFHSSTTLRGLVFAVSLRTLWSLSLFIIDAYALNFSGKKP